MRHSSKTARAIAEAEPASSGELQVRRRGQALTSILSLQIVVIEKSAPVPLELVSELVSGIA